LKSGVECEFFLITPGSSVTTDGADKQKKHRYDQSALMRRSDTISETCDAMLALGCAVSERPRGRERAVRDELAVCAGAGHRGIAMRSSSSWSSRSRKSMAGAPRSCRSHSPNSPAPAATRMFRCCRENVTSRGELGLFQLGYQFLAGVLAHAEALCALTSPTANINAAMTLSGATRSPNTVTSGGNTRTHMIRFPDAGRFELRLANGAAIPYLLQAGLLAAGMDGIASGRAPGERLDINMYTQGHTVADVRWLPLNLLDAPRTFEQITAWERTLDA
jgi:glutamine synthetase